MFGMLFFVSLKCHEYFMMFFREGIEREAKKKDRSFEGFTVKKDTGYS